MDPRLVTVAKTIMYRSLEIKPGQTVLISAVDDGQTLIGPLVEEAYRAGAIPLVWLGDAGVIRALLNGATAEQLELLAAPVISLMEKTDCYVGITAYRNLNELAELPQEAKTLYQRHYKAPVRAAMMKTNWVTLTFPNIAFAQNAGMSLRDFEDYYFDLLGMDYDKLAAASAPLAKRMREADTMRIVAPDTDLTVSLKGFTALASGCKRNLPGGEVASTPAIDSANGYIHFNIPSPWNGFLFEDVRLTFENGRVVEASANDTERFLREISLDEGCRYIGEFSLGTNPHVTRPMRSILFDEKMGQSMHLALGSCNLFPGRDNGNRSTIHWDLIQSHRPEYGGGEVYIDGELVRKDGLFVVEDCKGLNPDVFLAKV